MFFQELLFFQKFDVFSRITIFSKIFIFVSKTYFFLSKNSIFSEISRTKIDFFQKFYFCFQKLPRISKTSFVKFYLKIFSSTVEP